MEISSDNTVDFPVRKVVHLVIYGALCASFYRVTGRWWPSIALSGLYGLFDEYHQLFTPLRSGRISDVIIDLTGALVSAWLLWNYYPRLPKKLKNWLKP
jgi:VanZ family protein